MNALVVEDDPMSRKILTSFLSPYADIDIAVDGEEAIEAYSKALRDGQPYELICLDVIMPKVDGIAVLEHVRKTEKAMGLDDNARTKILMTTVVSDKEKVLKIFKSGCDGYMRKPYKKDRMDEELKRLGLIDG